MIWLAVPLVSLLKGTKGDAPCTLCTKLCLLPVFETSVLQFGIKYHASLVIKMMIIIITFRTNDLYSENRCQYARAQPSTKDCNPPVRTDILPTGVLVREDLRSLVVQVVSFSP